MNKVVANLPSTRALVAFESAARLGNFSRAADELNTSQSAISRHIAELEARLQAPLFIRERRTVRLTEQGEFLAAAVRSGLRTIREATQSVATWGHRQSITIACTHEISHLFVMPRFERLQANVGPQSDVRVLTYEYDTMEQVPDHRIDIILAYNPTAADILHSIIVKPEAVRPVCAPSFQTTYTDELSRAPSSWQKMPLLRLSRPNRGWATWDDWFRRAGGMPSDPTFIDIENYVYLLEAAAAGRGLALGWRGLVDRHIANGTLVPAVAQDEATFDNALYAIITSPDNRRPAAVRCARELALPVLQMPALDR